VLDFLKDQEQAGNAAYVNGLHTLMRRYANEGRQGLTTDQYHHADREKDIWEFIRGPLRIYFVVVETPTGRGRLVLLSHGIVKKHQKTKAGDKTAAERLRAAYRQALADGTLKIDK